MKRPITPAVIALLTLAACAPSQRSGGAFGPYPDRAARDRALRSLEPAEQMRLMSGWAAAPGEGGAGAATGATSFRDLPIEEQERLVDEYMNATPERRREMEKQAGSSGR
jgi:hypothetical protein